jgi:hypothetical protein
MTRALPHRRTLFIVSALTLAVACITIVRSALYRTNPDIAAWGVTIDLTVSIPLLYYFFLVRTRQVAPLTIIPVFVVCMALATRVVPVPQQSMLQQLRFLAAPLDLVTIWMIVRRAARLRSISIARGDGDDPVARFRVVATQLFGNAAIGEAVAFEVATFWFSIAGWRKPRREGFTFHERAGWDTILVCILVLVVSESIGVHLFLQRWSATAAWVVTALDLYGMIWLIGDYHALRLRVTTVTPDALELRYGIRWYATIARDNIASVERVQKESQWKRKGVLKIALLDEPRVLVTLREPVVAHAFAGITKRIDALALLPDDVEGFEAALRREDSPDATSGSAS